MKGMVFGNHQESKATPEIELSMTQHFFSLTSGYFILSSKTTFHQPKMSNTNNNLYILC